MDIQYYGANCILINHKSARFVIDDNLDEIGGYSITKDSDVALFTHKEKEKASIARLAFDGPGEYEVADVSIMGIAARAHIDEEGKQSATMFKLMTGEISVLLTGHIYPDLSASQLETIGLVDVLIVPVGGNGYTLDAVGVLKLIKDIEPSIVIPTHYLDQKLNYPLPQQKLETVLKEMAMDVKETLPKLRLKPNELRDNTQLIVLQRV